MNRHLKLTESCFYNSKNSTGFFLLSVWRGHWPRQVTGPLLPSVSRAKYRNCPLTAEQQHELGYLSRQLLLPQHPEHHPNYSLLLFDEDMVVLFVIVPLVEGKKNTIFFYWNSIKETSSASLHAKSYHHGVLVVHVCHHSFVELLRMN